MQYPPIAPTGNIGAGFLPTGIPGQVTAVPSNLLSPVMRGWYGISRFAQGIATSVTHWIDQVRSAATAVADTMLWGGLQPCLASTGAPSFAPSHAEDPRISGLSFMLMDGPGGSFMIMSAAGGPIIYSYTHTLAEFRALLSRQGYSAAEITVEIARLDWNWLRAKRQTRIAEEAQGPLPEGWGATGDVQYVSVSIHEDGRLKDWTPLGALTERQLAIFRPNSR